MISITGMTSFTALKLIDATQDRQLETIRSQAQHQRAIDYFSENIGDVETVDQLIEDPELYGFVMRAFDLEDQIFGKAMIEKILKSNIEESDALVNKLTDVRFREMYEELGFGTDGVGNLNTASSTWRQDMVDRYVERQFINSYAEENETVATALEFRNKVADIDSPYDILKDTGMSEFFRTALGLPESIAQLDIDRQAEIIEAKIDLETLSDPEVQEQLVRKYIAISDIENNTAASTSAALTILTGSDATSIISATLDILPVGFSASSLYR
ncbi:DUF1217 domain-containing protein [Pseudooceanicola sp. C21-150M6]|uniref:DUF1217 domain-containing protein n=1 Tax=Pseudooceanicola sp. C21-150M6 TaxID=3434355 RepID=UPI003D7FA523